MIVHILLVNRQILRKVVRTSDVQMSNRVIFALKLHKQHDFGV